MTFGGWYIIEVMKKIIVAYDKNYGIGAHNDLLWQRDLPADLQHFKQLTIGHPVIMGRNTYLSIGRPLPGRRNIVICYQDEVIDGVEVVTSLEAAYALAGSDQDVFVIGGGQIYSLAFDTVDQIIATEVNAQFDQATIFFPAVEAEVWREIDRQHHQADDRNLYDYDFVTYQRL